MGQTEIHVNEELLYDLSLLNNYYYVDQTQTVI